MSSSCQPARGVRRRHEDVSVTPGLPLLMADSPSSEESPPSDHHSSASFSPTSASYISSNEAEPVATSSRAGASKPGRTPSRYDWSKHMPIIKRLYIDEDKTLREVLDIMAAEHNFVATPRMVKTRLKKWNYSKNVSVKSDEVESLMGLIFDAESQGDVRKASTEVKLSTGRVVGLDRVAAHLRRKKLSPNVLQKASQLSLARYGHGQSPSPISLVIDAPLVFRIPETIFADIHASVQAHVSSSTEVSSQVFVMKPQEKKVFNLTFSARELYVQGKMDECFALLRVVPDRIKDVFQSDRSLFPFSIFTFVIHLLSIPGAEELRNTVKALVRYAAAAVSEAHPEWPPDHPFRRILLSLTQVEESSLLDIAVGGYKQQLISFESLTGPSTKQFTIGPWLDLGESAGSNVLPFQNLETSLSETYQRKIAESGEHQEETIHLLFLLAELERQKVKARGISPTRQTELLMTVLGACQDFPTDTPLTAEFNCHYYLAKIFKTEGRKDLAEHHMRMCIYCLQRRGEAALAVHAMTDLQTWLQEWGEDAQVQSMKENINLEIVDLQVNSVSG